MTELEGAFQVGDVLCLPIAGEDAHYHYLPLSAGLQRNPDGSAQAQLFVAGSTAFLQLTSVWGPDAAPLEALRDELQRRDDRDPPTPVRLSFAPVKVSGARLLLLEDGDAREIARSQGSNTPPFSALFSATISATDKSAVTAAMNGEPGILSVVYEATLVWPVTHTAHLSGRLSGLTDRAGLEEALQDGRAQLDLAPGAAALFDAFLDRAVEMLALPGVVPAGAQTRLEIRITVEETAEISAAADVGAWMSAGGPPVNPTLDPVTPPLVSGGDGPGELTVSADLEGLSDLIAMVEIRREGAAATLTPASPQATLPADDTDAPLTISTHYLSGGAPFVTETPTESGAKKLTPEEMGVALIRIDASPLAEAGFDEARVTLRYRPDNIVDRATQTVRFRAPFAPALWPVATRGAPLGESLTYEARASGPGGARLRVDEAVAETPDITLTPRPQNED